MPANIARINGQDAFAATGERSAVWHTLGQYTGFETAEQWAKMAELAQLNWQVVKRDLYMRPMPGAEVFMLPDQKAMVRDVDGAYIGTVGKDYEPIQNATMFTYADSLLGAIDGAHWETAGALGSGERIFGLARLPIVSNVRTALGDVTHNFLLFTGSHDGSASNSFQLCRTRVVCNNTLNIALTEANRALKFKHTKNVKFRMDQVLASVQSVKQAIADQDGLDNLLAVRRVTKESMLAVMDRMFPVTAGADGRSTKQNNIAKMVLELFESNDNNAIPEIRGTALNLVNAFTEYADHFRNVRVTEGKQGLSPVSVRAEGSLFGSGDAFKTDARTAVLELTTDAPTIASSKPTQNDNGGWLKAMGISL